MEDWGGFAAVLAPQAAQERTVCQGVAGRCLQAAKEAELGQLFALETSALEPWADSASAWQDSAAESVAVFEDSRDRLVMTYPTGPSEPLARVQPASAPEMGPPVGIYLAGQAGDFVDVAG